MGKNLNDLPGQETNIPEQYKQQKMCYSTKF